MQVGRGGGAAFVLLYLGCVFLICFPIMIAEIAIGRAAQRDPVASFKVLKPGTPWWVVGAIGVMAGVGILSFYSVIAGWVIAYIWYTLTGAVAGSPDAIGTFFSNFTANGALNLGLTTLVMVITAAVLLGGVKGGIERATKVMMPALFIILVLLAVRALTLPGAGEGLSYYLRPNAERIGDYRVWNAALGQAFFSLSLGMGCMITYGSYLSKQTGVPIAAAWVTSLDTAVALLAGFVVFPAGFSIAGFDPTTGGPGLIFAVLPRLFATVPGGHLFGAAFFVLLTLAALTSTFSLLEVPVSHFVDRGWSRKKAVLAVAAGTLLLAIPSVLANGASTTLSRLPVVNTDFLTLMASVWNNFALPIGGFFIALFVGWAWPVDKALAELTSEGASFPGRGTWVFLIRYVCPLAILFIIVMTARGMFSA